MSLKYIISNIAIQKNGLFSDTVNISVEQKEKLCNILYYEIKKSEDAKAPLLAHIENVGKYINIEPNEEQRVSPWPDAARTCDFLMSNHVRIITSIMIRSLVMSPYWMISIPNAQEFERAAEDGLNYYGQNFMHIDETLRDCIKLSIEESTAFAEVNYTAKETTKEIVQEYMKMEDFYQEYPVANYEQYGFKSKQDYDDFTDEVAKEIDRVKSVKITGTKYINNTYINADTYNIDETCIIPFNSSNIQTSKGAFFRVELTNDDLLRYADMEFFDKEEVDSVINTSIEQNDTTYESQQDTRYNTQNDASGDLYTRKIFKGAYRYILDEELGLEEEFYIYFAWNEKKLLRIERYMRIDNERPIVVFKPLPIHRKIYGDLLPKYLEDGQEKCSTLDNQIFDNNKMGNMPSYSVSVDELSDQNSTFKDKNEYSYYPGSIAYLKNPNGFRQIQTSQLDYRSMLAFKQDIYRNAQINTGATDLLSGKESVADPTAPGNKTRMQLTQSTLRLDEYVSSLRIAVGYMGKYIFNYLVMIMPNEFKDYMLKFQKEALDSSSPDKAIIVPQDIEDNVFVEAKAVSTEYNNYTLANESREFISTVLTNPAFAQNPKAVITGYERLFAQYRLRPKEVEAMLGPLRIAAQQQDQQMEQMKSLGGIPPETPPPMTPEQFMAAQQGGGMATQGNPAQTQNIPGQNNRQVIQ